MSTPITHLVELLQNSPEDVDFDEFPIALLVQAAKMADDAYENGEDPPFPDASYDALKQFIAMAAPTEKYLLEVGSDVRGGKVVLPNSMGSLTQAYVDNDFKMWLAKHKLTMRSVFCVTEKLDGMSGSLHFGADGRLRIAYSRGNGFEGADITRHVKHIKRLPKQVPPMTEVRCEIIISKANFDIVKKLVFRRDGSEYKNPRNMISGLMNSSEIPMVAYDYIDCIVYHDWNELAVNKTTQLEAFLEMGFCIPSWESLLGSQLTEAYLTPLLNAIRKESPYDIDGIVIEADEPADRLQMNPSKATLNPEYARKYKVSDPANNAVATVHYVELRVSKRGYIKPRVHFIPFALPGITVTHSSGYNMKFIIDNGICPGAKVQVHRAGDVIPNIIGVVDRGSYTREEFYDDLTDIGDWHWSKNDAGEEVDAVLDGDHANIVLKLTEAFFTGIGVDGLKLGNLKKLFDVGFNTPEKVIKATADEMGFALASQSTADKIHASLHKCLHNITLPQFMGASGLFGRGIGKRKIQQLYDVFGKDIVSVTKDTRALYVIDKWETKSINKFLNGLPVYLAFYESVKEYVQFIEKEVVEGNLNGQVFVFTGFRNKELQAKIEAAGGEVVDSISSKVTCVIAADPDESSGKLNKARAKGTKILGLADVNDLFEG